MLNTSGRVTPFRYTSARWFDQGSDSLDRVQGGLEFAGTAVANSCSRPRGRLCGWWAKTVVWRTRS